jgi:H+/Cl- antiporter ClcA
MRIGKSALVGAVLGLFVGLAYTGITLFQFDRTEFTTGELLVAGFAVAVPVAVMGGFLAGWAWSLFFDRRE